MVLVGGLSGEGNAALCFVATKHETSAISSVLALFLGGELPSLTVGTAENIL